MLAPVSHTLPLTTIRRERCLRTPGKVLLRKGQKVSATDVVAESTLNPEHLLLDVARGLGMPAGRADEHLAVKAGTQVTEGDVLAGPVGLTRRVVRAPRSGRVVLAGSGQVLIELQSKPFTLKAGIPGEVVGLVGERGVVVETTGALIQGVWGNGQINAGVMYCLAKEPGHVLTADQLDISYRGGILVGGICVDKEVLINAEEMVLRGLVLSSLDPALIPLARGLSLPICLLEGFGRRPFNSAAFKLLSTNEQREAALNAEPWDPFTGTRPELVIPLPASGAPPAQDVGFFTSGQQVHILRAPHAGKLGTFIKARGSIVLPSGVRAAAAEVRLEDGASAVIPLANLEILA